MDYDNMDVVMVGLDKEMPEEKKPAKLIKVVKKTDKKNHFQIQILHPNKNKEGIHDILYDKVHRISSDSEDQMEQFILAQGKANEILSTYFSDVKTTHEDIKYIPAGKKGKMKLNTRPEEKEEEKKCLTIKNKKNVAKLEKKEIKNKKIKKEVKVAKKATKKKKSVRK